ncbi:hypothetical protein ES968_01185 [Bacillus subtilis]|nr:hypothetical protein D9C11_12435 [Bacillus subtilis subsp. subtilis]QAR77866.1 hypothetical protein EQH95_01180 [Bacillus subtilis]AYK69121.1 hypothetical protein D9C09_04720 [Bacillus subtilis subsp. subtilis]AYK72832.1 hypothetical protein D9C12_02545 [Bacillus subtilis subsp. subtilis]AYK99787.1 hypothetical protein D9C08_04610 [Bacillus subtilis subsp. subtilis]
MVTTFLFNRFGKMLVSFIRFGCKVKCPQPLGQ